MQRKMTAAGLAERAKGQVPHAKAAEGAESAETLRSDPPPIPRPKLFGTPVLRILSNTRGETVGYLYEWDNGERQPLWLSDPVGSITYAPLQLTTRTEGEGEGEGEGEQASQI